MKVLMTDEVRKAVTSGKPVVALESTIIAHGMPFPQNLEMALQVEKEIRGRGAMPATIAIVGGRLRAGLSPRELEAFAKAGPDIMKVSTRDIRSIAMPWSRSSVNSRSRAPVLQPATITRLFSAVSRLIWPRTESNTETCSTVFSAAKLRPVRPANEVTMRRGIGREP